MVQNNDQFRSKLVMPVRSGVTTMLGYMTFYGEK